MVSVLLVAAGLACAPKPESVKAPPTIALPFIENDFALALSRAREAKLPVFVEVWAPW
jgi:hypothetical protein